LNLLVGATGFVGGHLVEYLFQQGEICKATFRKGSHLKILDLNGVQGTEAELTDHHALHDAMEGVDVVYNLASPMPGADLDFHSANTEGLLNLLEVATEAKVKAFVHLSTLDVYGFGARGVSGTSQFNPGDDYQKSKAEAERLLQEFSKRNPTPRVAVVRAAKAVGSRDESLVVPILRMVAAGRVVLPAAGAMSFTHPRDIAQAMYKLAIGTSPTGGAFLVKSFDSTPEEFARGISTAVGKETDVRRQGFLSASPVPKYTAEQLKAGLMIEAQPYWKDFGYTPAYTLKGTCEEIAAWYKKEPWVTESA
jgi:oxidoreductase